MTQDAECVVLNDNLALLVLTWQSGSGGDISMSGQDWERVKAEIKRLRAELDCGQDRGRESVDRWQQECGRAWTEAGRLSRINAALLQASVTAHGVMLNLGRATGQQIDTACDGLDAAINAALESAESETAR